MTWHIPLSDLDYGPEEAAAVQRVLQSKWLSMGPETKAFEEEFAAHIGVKHAIAVANGTAALHLAYLALGIGPGDAVIQPTVNFVAAANMTRTVGATPVFADINSLDEPTISPESISALLSTLNSQLSTVRPKALVVMHYGGYCCRMAEIQQLCRQHGLALIEDACHAVGARATLTSPISHLPSPAVAAGSLGDIGCFSFFSNKNMATGEGGMVVTNRDDLAEHLRLLRSHGMTSLTWDRHRGHASSYDVIASGFNYRLDDLRSALGREQLNKLERNNQRRRELTTLYWRNLAPLEQRGWVLPFRRMFMEDGRSKVEDEKSSSQRPSPTANSGPLRSCPDLPSSISHLPSSCAAHLLAVVAPDEPTRLATAHALKAAGVQTSLHYPSIHRFKAFAGSGPGQLELSESYACRVITLPLFPTMSTGQVEEVCSLIRKAAVADGARQLHGRAGALV